MPYTDNILPNDILNLIKEPDLNYTAFQPYNGHYIRCTVLKDGIFLKQYRSDTLWTGQKIYYKSGDSDFLPYYDSATTEQVCAGTEGSVTEVHCDGSTQDWYDIVQLPLFKDSDGNVVSKPLIRDWDIDSVEDLVRELPTNEEILSIKIVSNSNT